jgi:sugar phosphate isomerase/epimerase
MPRHRHAIRAAANAGNASEAPPYSIRSHPRVNQAIPFPTARMSSNIPFFTRRQFIASTIAATASGAVCRGAGEAAGSKPAPSGPTFGFSTYGMKNLTTEQGLKELAAIGYDSVELDSTAGRDADPANLTPARRADIRKIAGDLGLKLTALQGPGTPSANDKQHEATLERIKVLAQLAHDLSPEQPPLLENVLGGKDPWEKMKPFFVRRLTDWVKAADSSDITIAVKPHRDSTMDRPEEAVELIKELGSPARLRINYDYSHFALRDMPMADTIRVVLPWTAFVALKDVAIENGRTSFKLPGETKQIDYAALIRQFQEGGYRGDYNCEISAMIFNKPGFDYLAAAKISYDNIAPAFVAAGVKRVKRA